MKKIALVLIILCSISLHAQDSTNKATLIEIGDMYRELVLPDLNNDVEIKLSDYCGKGNYTLVEFGASWLANSRRDAVKLKKYYEKYHPCGLNIISVFVERNKKNWEKFVINNEIKWPHVSDLKGFNGKAKEVYGVTCIPTYILFNPQGFVIFMKRGEIIDYERIGSKLQEIYGY